MSLTGGKRHDVTQLIPPPDAIPRIRPRHRPKHLLADRGHDTYHRLLRTRDITPKSARKGTAHGSGPGKTRWVVERPFA